MANINGYLENCDSCGQKRTCNDAGLCHKCQVDSDEASVIVDADGQEWVPGGFRL